MRHLSRLVVLLLAVTCAAAQSLTQAKVDQAATAIAAKLAEPKAAVPPTAVLYLQWLARATDDARLREQCAGWATRAEAALDQSPVAQAVRLSLLLAQVAPDKDGTTDPVFARAAKLADGLCEHQGQPGAAPLGGEAIIALALANAGQTLSQPEVTAMGERVLREAMGAMQPVTAVPATGLRQEAYGLAALAAARLKAFGRKVDDLLTPMRATMKAAYGAADGSYLAEPGGNPSLRDGRATSGNASAALMLLDLAEAKVDEGALAEAKKLLDAVLDEAKPSPEYAGLWWAAARYLKLAPPEPPKPAVNASREVSLAATLAEPLKPGSDAVVNIKLTMNEPYHIYANKPGNDNVVATEVTATLPAGCRVKSIDYPEGERVTAAGEPVMVYSGTVTIRLTISTPASLAADAKANLAVRLQACDEDSCLRPTTMKVDLALR